MALRELVVRFELATGLHIYDDPVPKGMVATRIEVEAPQGIRFRETIKPPTHPLQLKELGIELHVWDGRVDFVLPFYADDSIVSLVTSRGIESVNLKIKVHYQACDDKVCHIPSSETLELSITVSAYIDTGIEGETPGAEPTDMDSGKLMAQKIKRGFARYPIRTVWNLLKLTVSHLFMPRLK